VQSVKMRTDVFLVLIGLVILPSTRAAGDANCDLCVTIVSAVEEFVLAGDTMEDIVNKTEQFCDTLGPLKPLCEDFLERFLPGIIEDIIENNLNPCDICKIITSCYGNCEATTPPPTPEPRPWVYVETALEGGRVLTVEPDNHHCWMAHKQDKDGQLWRLEDNGCLRNKAHMDRCLGLETHTTGGGVYLQVEEGIDSQRWKYENKYIVNLSKSNSIWVADDLSLNVIWADIPLVTDGAAVDVIKQDDTLSMHWHFVQP